eukprot:scaffold2537_cov304-Pinguiococcus_pyrenoidosus.AAC.4
MGGAGESSGGALACADAELSRFAGRCFAQCGVRASHCETRSKPLVGGFLASGQAASPGDWAA